MFYLSDQGNASQDHTEMPFYAHCRGIKNSDRSKFWRGCAIYI